ncbi:hypothetical protein CHUAL_008992 [Chamberlinius hualienensis]
MEASSNADHLHVEDDVNKMSSTSSGLEDVKHQPQYLTSQQLQMKDQRGVIVQVEDVNDAMFKDEAGSSYVTQQQHDVNHFTQSADYSTGDGGELVSSSQVVLSSSSSSSTSSIDGGVVTEFLNRQSYFNDSRATSNTVSGGVYQLSASEVVNVNNGDQNQYLDPALLRIIDSKLTNMLGNNLNNIPADQKEMIYESVVRNVIGLVSSNHRVTSYSNSTSNSTSANNVVVGGGGGSAEDKLDLSSNAVVQVDAGIFGEEVNNMDMDINAIDDVELHVINDRIHSDDDAAAAVVQMPSDDDAAAQLMQVRVSTVDGGRLLNFVSSSSGLDGREVVCLENQNVLLEEEGDVVVSSHPSNGHDKTLHLVHDAGQPFSIELENPGFTDDDDRYATEVSVIHQLETDENVTSTVDIVQQEEDEELEEEETTRAGGGSHLVTTTSIDLPLNSMLQQRLHIIDVSMTDDSSIIAIPDNKSNQRPKRNANKNRLIKNDSAASSSSTSSSSSSSTSTSSAANTNEIGKWCEECHVSYLTGCSKHRVQQISDKPVLTRARASLPAPYLSILKVDTHSNGQNVYGVVAKKSISKRTQFGPVEGVLIQQQEMKNQSSVNEFVLQLETMDNELVTVDVSDENQCNWMGFVRAAESYKEQNLVVLQQEHNLFYITTKTILPKTELKVGYSVQYASRRGLNVLQHEKDEEDNSWPCFECNQSFCSSEELQQHLNEHDNIVNESNPFDESEKVTSANVKKSKSKTKSAKKSTKNKNKKSSSETIGEFRCELCAKVFPRQYSLQRHQALHSGEKKYKCTVCDKSFTHVYNRNRHLRRHRVPAGNSSSTTQNETEVNVGNSLNSSVSSSSTKKASKTLFKKKQQVEGNEWECTNCNLTFDNPNLLNLHTLTHAAEDVAGLDDFTMDDHQQDFNTENGCYPSLDDGNSSSLIGGVNEVLQCPQCTQNFPTKKQLIEHASTHGKIQQKKSYRGVVNPAKPYKCELCYKAFAAEDRLQRHMMVHGSEDEKPLQCCFCEKRFLNNSALACHIKVHSDEKRIYECPICKEEFDQVVMLKEHIRIHSISGYFTCPSCQKSFDEYNQIRKHIRIFHSDKKFPCDHCDKVFPRPDKLKLHMLRHSTHREFLCASCGKQFKRKDKLKEHMKRMHSMEREARLAMKPQKTMSIKKFIPKVLPTDYHRFIYKCHSCLLGFKRRGMLVNHLAKRHPEIRPDTVPELNLPILKTTRDYYCQYCEKIYKSSSKRKAHIMKQHPGAELPMSNRRKGGIPEIPGVPNPTYSQTVGSVTTLPHNCEWCHKQYASKAKLLQHQRKKHMNLLPESQQIPRSHHRESKMSDQMQSPESQVFINDQVTVTTQTSDVEFNNDSVSEETKQLKGPQQQQQHQHQVAEIYVDQDQVHATVVVAHDDKMNQVTSSGDVIPATDLLTQAMSELTQSLDVYVTTHEYNNHLQRADQSQQSSEVVVCTPTFVTTPPHHSSASSPSNHHQQQQHQQQHNVTEVTIDRSQLGHLLGSVTGADGSSGSVGGGGGGQSRSETVDDAMQITSSFIQQSWTRNNFSDYNQH